MNYYAIPKYRGPQFLVTWLDDAGGLCTRLVRAWHASAAERCVAQTLGGFYHSATEVSPNA